MFCGEILLAIVGEKLSLQLNTVYLEMNTQSKKSINHQSFNRNISQKPLNQRVLVKR